MSQLYYNMALLSSLQGPINDSLSVLDQQLEKFLTKQIDNSQVTGHQEIHQVVGSLAMIECRALNKICLTIEAAAKGICFADRRGWNAETLINVSDLTRKLIKEVKEHLSFMVAGEPELAVKIWPYWSSLKVAIGESTEDVYSLYEPSPIFENNEFRPLALEDLKEMGDGAWLVLKNSVMELDRISKSSSPNRSEELELTFKKVYSAIDRVYSARHRRGYQAYWMCLKARIIKALNDGGEAILLELNQWKDIFLDASVQAKKFGEDSRRVGFDSMTLVVRPFLKRWPENLFKIHDIFGELEKVLNLKSFWYWSEVVQSQEKKEAFEEHKRKEDELKEAFENMHLSWSKFSVDQTDDVRPFLKALSEILKKNSAIENKNAIVLFKAVGACAQKINSDKNLAYDDVFMEECATALLVIEEELNRKNKNETFFNKQVEIQSKRIQALFSKEDLSKLPRVKIDEYSKKKLIENAFKNVIKKSVLDLEEVERILRGFLFEGESNDVSLMVHAENLCRIAEKVLSVIGIKETNNLLIYLSNLIYELSTRNEKNPKLDKAQKATIILSSVIMFLKGVESNDEVAFKHLKSGLDLIGENLSSRELEEKNLDRIYSNQEQIEYNNNFKLNQEFSQVVELPVEDLKDYVEKDNSIVDVEKYPEQELPILVEENVSLLKGDYEEEVVESANLNVEDVSSIFLEKDSGSEELEVSTAGGRGSNKKILPLLLSDEGFLDKPELIEIFDDVVVESTSLLTQIDEVRENLKNDRENQDELASLRRIYHTLKGGFRLSGLKGMGELCFLIEERLNIALNREEPYTVKIDELIEFSKEKLFSLINQLMIDGEVLVFAKDLKDRVDSSYPEGFDLITDHADDEESDDLSYDFGMVSNSTDEIGSIQNNNLKSVSEIEKINYDFVPAEKEDFNYVGQKNSLLGEETFIVPIEKEDFSYVNKEDSLLVNEPIIVPVEKVFAFNDETVDFEINEIKKPELIKISYYEKENNSLLQSEVSSEQNKEIFELESKQKTPWDYKGIDEELLDILIKEIKALRNNIWQALEANEVFESNKTKEICLRACHTIVALSKDYHWEETGKLCKILEEKLAFLISESQEISDEAMSVLDFSFKEVLTRLNVILETSEEPRNVSVAFDSVSNVNKWFKEKPIENLKNENNLTLNKIEEKFEEAKAIVEKANQIVDYNDIVDEEEEQWQQVFVAIEGISNNMQILAEALSVLSEKRMKRDRND